MKTNLTREQLEICVDNIQSVINAEQGGANRIELCSALSEGGLTPTIGLLKMAKTLINIPIFVMIRPRSGDFLYSEKELQLMEMDLTLLKENGADGFVFGVLDEHGNVDESGCARLLKAAENLPCTFHRAFDVTHDPLKSLETIINLAFSRILTSGQSASAHAGMSCIKKLVVAAKGRIKIMAGAGVNPENAAEILSTTGVKQLHGSARVRVSSLMKAKQSNVTMGRSDASEDGSHFETSVEIVQKLAAIINQSALELGE